MNQRHTASISYPIPKIGRGGIPEIGNGGYRKSVTQNTVIQQTDLQHRDSNGNLQINRPKNNKEYRDFKAVGELLKNKTARNKTARKKTRIQEVPESLKVTIEEIS